ncbi:uncharacterized protein LOC119075076 [Bradysia coprophila]|uniref:uncharacterized protein LOC119075076 n=1 Tax=Bradysia coprophila TaxID=38358 RepID=UPI00187DD46C|nr:uncharacterized protein LOC119075076 [Bradysia coprophila]
MNNKKGWWKTGNFKWSRILLCIVLLFVPSWASIPYEEIRYKLFDGTNHNIEAEILKSLQTTKNVFAIPEVKNAVLLSFLPGLLFEVWVPISTIIFVMVNLLAKESDWRDAFSRTIASELERGIALGHILAMKATMETINTKFDLLKENEDNPEELRRSIASFIHRECDIMLNLFAAPDSYVKKSPLLGAPLLIELAQLVTLFQPIAKALISREAKNPDLICKARNILADYRPRTINARLEKLHENSTKALVRYINELSPKLSEVMSIAYNQYGYNKTTPATINCQNRCNSNDCLRDDFGDSYRVPPWSCAEDYALFLRHRIEEMFNIDLLDSLCVDKPTATGFGWLTIRIRELRGIKLSNDKICEHFSPCDPFIRLTIGGNLFETQSKTDTYTFDVDVVYTSPKISKQSMMKVELYDDDGDDNPELILRAEGNIDSFLRRGFRSFPVVHTTTSGRNIQLSNFVDTVSFWQDEYDYKNVSKQIN